MFFRKKRPSEPLPPPPAGTGAEAAGPTSDTQFLTGDARRDSASVEGLLDEVASISERVARVTGPGDLEELLAYIVDASVQRTGAERGLLVLAGADDRLQVRVARQRGGQRLDPDTRFSTSAVKRVLETGAPIKDVFNSAAEAMDLGASVFDLKLRALMAAPLSGGEPVVGQRGRGVLYVDSKAATREFTAQDLAFFSALSRQIAVALQSASLHIDSLEKTRLEQSLDLAKAIQGGLMPRIPANLPSFDLFGWYESAERTSGDFYDFVKVCDGSLGVVVGDVTGHGIGPALITASAQASLRNMLRVVDDPGRALTMLNQDLSERSDEGMFVTLFLALLSPDGMLRRVNAGHAPPLLYRAAGGEVQELRGDGPALSMIDDFQYRAGEPMSLEPGDVLLAFTDGLTEARSKDDPQELLGDERLRRAFVEAVRSGGEARAIVESVVRSVLEFAGGVREDDMTIVAVRRIRA